MLLKSANRAYREKNYRKARALYEKALIIYPHMGFFIKENIKMVERKLSESSHISSDINSFLSTEKSVFVGIAAIPERVEALRQVINSLIHQVDRIGVYLNGWSKVPGFLIHEKIVLEGIGKEDLGDVGKFYWVDDHKGVYFTCDDDLIYPSDYVVRTLDKLEKYNYKSVIGWHGSLIKDRFSEYYCKESRRVFVFSACRPYDTPVHVLGTGCCAFDTDTIPIKVCDFKHPNMADIFFALKGQELKVPFYIMAHAENEITEVDGYKDSSIYKDSYSNSKSKKNTRELQNQFVKSSMPWVTHEFSNLSVLVVGRFGSYSKGGIYKSCHLIKESLEKLGHSVCVVDTAHQFSEEVFNASFDICWIYPGDPMRPDFEQVDDKVKMLRQMQIPILVNLSYLSSEARSIWISEKVKEYNKGYGAPVLAAVFTETAANDPILKNVRDYICVLPKTLDPTPASRRPKFSEREGICLGDATKLSNPDIVGGSVKPWIDAISNRLPGVNLYAYKQYAGKNPHPKIHYVPHMREDFGDFLAFRRVFICLNVFLTFEMVSCEAQSYGTPVIYRHMPHSLSEYISATGIAVRTPEEMAEMVAWLYNNEIAWSSLSDSSYYNARSKDITHLQYSLEGYLRLAICRANSLSV